MRLAKLPSWYSRPMEKTASRKISETRQTHDEAIQNRWCFQIIQGRIFIIKPISETETFDTLLEKMAGKDGEGKTQQTKRTILEYPKVLEAFKQPPVQQDQPPQIQQDPPPTQQPPSSPEERWADPDDFLASSDLYLAQAPSSPQKHKSSSFDRPTTSRLTETQQASNEPDDEEEIQDFLRRLDQFPRRPDQFPRRPSAPNRKPNSTLQQPGPAPASPPFQAHAVARGGLAGDSTSQPKPYNLRIPPPRPIPKEKDPPDLDFRENHFG